MSIFKIFGVKGSGAYANDQKEHWIKNETHLDDQLKELNNYSKNVVEYAFDGDKIMSKTIHVCKLHSSLFNKNLSFSRIIKVYQEAEFNKEFILNTLKAVTPNNAPFTKLERKYPNYTIVMLGSEEQLKLFDSEGKGLNEMIDWYLCDGRNGTPDLRGVFIAGRHPDLTDYNRIGKKGGINQIKLTIDQMPYHTHLG